jgi:fatty acid synthase subunit beta
MPFPSQLTKNELIKQSLERGHVNPTPLLSVRNLSQKQLEKYINQINFIIGKDDPNRKISIALKNGPRNIVVAGHPETLHSLVEVLHKYEAPLSSAKDGAKGAQSRVPFSQRKLEPLLTYIDVSSPFHTQHLQAAVKMVLEDAKGRRLFLFLFSCFLFSRH